MLAIVPFASISDNVKASEDLYHPYSQHVVRQSWGVYRDESVALPEEHGVNTTATAGLEGRLEQNVCAG
jgi:hypothetical protein